MRYKEFYFENFKGIEKMRLPLTGGVTTLIGLNESGKTTILEAIFCFPTRAENQNVVIFGWLRFETLKDGDPHLASSQFQR